MTKIAFSFLLLFVFSFSFGQNSNNSKFSPKLGVCTSINNHELVAAAGYTGGISIEGNWGEKADFEKNLILARAYLQGQINTLN